MKNIKTNYINSESVSLVNRELIVGTEKFIRDEWNFLKFSYVKLIDVSGETLNHQPPSPNMFPGSILSAKERPVENKTNLLNLKRV